MSGTRRKFEMGPGAVCGDEYRKNRIRSTSLDQFLPLLRLLTLRRLKPKKAAGLASKGHWQAKAIGVKQRPLGSHLNIRHLPTAHGCGRERERVTH
jgi:hypothetical protein